MKVYWDKTAVIGLVGFMISLLLILCFMDRLSYPLVGIFLCLFGILLCGIYGALPKAGSPERQKIVKEKEKEKDYENEKVKEKETEKRRLNEYHEGVYRTVSPFLEGEELAWLKQATRAI